MNTLNDADFAAATLDTDRLLGLTHLSLRKEGIEYLHVAGDFWFPVDNLREPDLVEHDRDAHPCELGYAVPAVPRAVAHCLARPDSVVLGFGALAIHGLDFLCDAADTVLMAPVPRSSPASADAPGLRRRGCPADHAVEVTVGKATLRVADPLTATIGALRAIKQGEHSWKTLPIAGIDQATVMAVQLVDAVRRHLGITPEGIREHSAGLVNHRWIRKVLKLSSGAADSPKETEMRLLARSFAKARGLKLEEQVVVYRHGRIVTVLDLAISSLKIAIMYDGKHHWDHKQRHKDSQINIELELEGWRVIRVSAGTLPRLLEWLTDLVNSGGTGGAAG